MTIEFSLQQAFAVLLLSQERTSTAEVFIVRKINKIRPEDKIVHIPQNKILPNPNQPRKRFDFDELEGQIGRAHV